MKLNALKLKDGHEVVIKTAHRLYEDINTPVSLSCHLLLRYGEYDQLVNMDIDPLSYNTAWDYSIDNQAVSYLKKYPNLDTSFETADVALEKFLEAEQQCKETNDMLVHNLRQNSDVSSVFYIAQRKIANWLANTRLSLDDWRFGPGASSSCRGNLSSVYDKLQSTEVTLEAQWLLPLFRSMPHFRTAHDLDKNGADSCQLEPGKVHIVNYNRLQFVPKNAKTDRAICIEPDINIQGQLIAGAALRRALRRAGLELSSFSINRDSHTFKDCKAVRDNVQLAKIGSIDGSYATIDLSSASDTLSIQTVMSLLPFNWFELLSSLRSPYTMLPDSSLIENQKFSSMGNGFTFELETMIFYSLSLAVRDYLGVSGKVSVFGDDIVVPDKCVNLLLKVLQIAGFTPNSKKTFSTGLFRESCGFDFFAGHSVRAAYVKEKPEVYFDVYTILNRLRHAARRLGGDLNDCHPLYRRAWWKALSFIPTQYRYYGPEYLGDQVIWGGRREATMLHPQLYGLTKIEYVVVDMASRGIKRYHPAIQLGASLLESPKRIPLKRKRNGFKVKSCSISTWSWNEGAWIF